MLDEKNLDLMLEAVQACIGVTVRVIDQNGRDILLKGKISSFCKTFTKYLKSGDSCQEVHRYNSERAVDVAGSYIFTCHAFLNHITYPLVSKGAFLGAVMVGPFLMDEPDSSLILDISRKYPDVPMESLMDLYDDLKELPIVTPSLVTQLSRLLTFLFDGLITDSHLQFLANRQKMEQQSRIGEAIQMFKTSGEKGAKPYPVEMERELISKVKTGNSKEAKRILNDLLGYVLLSKGNDLETVKVRSIELCSLLSRAAIEGGAQTDHILRINNEYLKELVKINSIDALCFKLQECIDAFTESLFADKPAESNEVIKKAMSYISDHYAEKITLDDIAGEVHLNAAYLSTIFKQTTGSSFKEYLTLVRVEESKRLLANTDYSILDIAIATGFDDQSYFSKVFKRCTGLTPKQYR